MAKGQLRSNKEKKKPKQKDKPLAPVSKWKAPPNPWKKPEPQS
jgi:hypothetical protein